MKSYQDHLKTFLNPSPTHICKQASAIFPVLFSSEIKTKLCFVNYWKLKRNIEDLHCCVLLRDSKGTLALEKSFAIDKVKSYEVDLSKLVAPTYPFSGSIEIQFSSSKNLVFPYPGVTVVYEGKNCCSFVHSSQRIYNHSKESKQTERTSIVESGFNIYATENSSPFITLINGAKAINKQTLEYTAINEDQKEIHKSVTVSCNPFETLYLSLKDWSELRPHLKQGTGCLKIRLFNTHSFPRLIVGNFNNLNKSLSITHTYYDLSQSKREVDYWKQPNQDWHYMTLMLPLKEDEKYFSNVYFYPIYSPTEFWIDAEIYNPEGVCLKKISKFKKISHDFSFQCLNFQKHLDEIKEESLSVRLIAYPKNGCKIPSRIKIGFDVGFKDKGFPCNVCTNFSPANPTLEQKSQAFRWAPMMPHRLNGTIWCFNDSPKKEYLQEALIECRFYRKQDEKTLSVTYKIPPHGHVVIKHSQETKDFFQDSIGWCTINSNNPFISTYYFSEHSNQMIGADHGF
ncbi:MAG: hypothetical protein S4CHLAM6_10620 [Chlamydiae bacterium]|nr:hypothetical protein [Chlamydiota bacterium]